MLTACGLYVAGYVLFTVVWVIAMVLVYWLFVILVCILDCDLGLVGSFVSFGYGLGFWFVRLVVVGGVCYVLLHWFVCVVCWGFGLVGYDVGVFVATVIVF